MIAASEAHPHSGCPFWTSPLPTAFSFLAEIDRRHHKHPKRLESWSARETLKDTTEIDSIQDDDFQPNSRRVELVHSCEEISEQLLQIRNGLQVEHSAANAAQLRIFA